MVFIYGARNIGEFHATLYYNGGIFFMLGGCNFSSVNRHCSREFIEFFTVLFLLGLSIQSTRGVESNDIRGDGVLANAESQL